MRLLHTNNLAAYLRKAAVDGYILSVDYSDMKAVAAEIQKIGVNVNQMAKRINGKTWICKQDFTNIK